jgi:hypothetical protein
LKLKNSIDNGFLKGYTTYNLKTYPERWRDRPYEIQQPDESQGANS